MLRQPARFATLLSLGLLLTLPLAALGQGNKPLDFERDFGLSNLPDFGGPQLGATDVVFSAFIVPPRDGAPPLVAVQADVAPGYHIYSLTQPPRGPLRTEIALIQSPQFTLAAPFQADVAPQVSRKEEYFAGIDIEEHRGVVTWLAPLRLAADTDLRTLTIAGRIEGQLCTDNLGSCRTFDLLGDGVDQFTAKLATDEQLASLKTVPVFPNNSGVSPVNVASNLGEFAVGDNNPIIRGHVEPKIAAPGDTVRLVLSIEPQAGWHVYLREDKVPKSGSRPTLIVFTKTSGLTPKAPVVDTPIVEEKGQKYHQGQTTWTVEFPIATDVQPGAYPIEGILGYQVCSEMTCLPPSGVRFRGVIEIGRQAEAGTAKFGFEPSEYMDAAAALATSTNWPGAAPAQAVSASDGALNLAGLPLMILFSFMGGLILNLMPCVLPVIGLKVLSFAQQADQSRAKIFALNVWYSLGLLAVFLALATLAVSLNLGWGEQFTSTWFNVAMCALVFAMALSFLGVWEIPIPGFVGGKVAGKLESQEGIAGAFFKGVITTLLATPCSGPFLGPVFGFTLNQPWYVTYIIFASIGLGMALPYLVIGAFPALVRLIPRPGAWMDTFKQLMGFVLLGTVVFIFSFMNKDYLVATFAMLVGVWLACWWIGRTPLTASETRRTTAWLGGLGVALATTVFAFTALVPSDTKIPWQPYSPAALAEAQAAGKTVMVDFTADWCLTCKTNLKFAINTDDVHQKVEQNSVVPLLADWTGRSTEIKDALAKLESRSIPVLAIYPAGRPNEVIVLRDLLSEGQVLKALEQAGPSKIESESDSAPRTAMMPPS